ncbi:MAG: hypothetical protein A2857_02925 [Candidatus Levybacteria bacterium RIFCSPHIGHO2_01_FULL_36_15]|nr:MAG: hypothetical protein A2857_02925 [Candidatus Levybacteria bacterium RIFCSPHIGHO2_01_FULL_36_15]OGH38742.1 MAG: hypothetical protein A2905_06760 [Candidatus Levybacteria bacterium RIFCSPLOWO2_01_FULL_36_10]
METLNGVPKEVLCKKLEFDLKTEGVGYGSKHELWLVSPQYFLVSGEQLSQMIHSTMLFQELRAGREKSNAPFYLRGDFIPLANGKMAIAEYNEVPVGEGEITALREVYKKNLDYPGGYDWPYSNAASNMSGFLNQHFPGQKIGILIPPARINYLMDYFLLSQYSKAAGVDMVIVKPEDSAEKLAGVDVLYRTFQHNDLEDVNWKLGQTAFEKVSSGQMDMFPAFPKVGAKELMAKVFMENCGAKELQAYLPWTWLIESDKKPVFKGHIFSWEEVVDGTFPNPLVAKAVSGREAKQIIFSDSPDWQKRLSLILSDSSEKQKWIIQEDFSKNAQKFSGLPYYSWGIKEPMTGKCVKAPGMKTLDKCRARVCFTCVGYGGSLQPVDADVSLLPSRIVHTTSNCVHLPVLAKL